MRKARRVIVSPDPKESQRSKSGRNESSAARYTTAVACRIPKFVWLQDWWLEKAYRKGLAVGGFACRETKGVRIFCSAAIAKRLDTTTLETIDGITITISGLINRSRTYQNGFPFEVCNRFMLGFPYCWEEYAARCYGEESVNRRVSGLDEANASSGSTAKGFLPVALDELPVTRVCDLLVSVHRDYESSELKTSIYNGILSKLRVNAFNHQTSVDPDTEKSSETRRNHKKGKVDEKSREHGGISGANNTELPNSNESEMGLHVRNQRRGVSTRSMTKLDYSKRKGNENISSNSSVNDESRNSRDQYREMGINSTSSNENHAAAKSRNDKRVKGTSVRSTRSRLKNRKE